MSKELIKAYQEILSPVFPEFLRPFIELPLLQRLAGIGLLCGTDWTKLYKNRFFYSRLDHSIGVALIIWNFTGDKAQALAGLLHDVSTPAFSHVADFRNNDALHQESTESGNARIIRSNEALAALLEKEGLSLEDVVDYHRYPVADNPMPKLSADRLEYMYMTGLIMEGLWSLEDIKRSYEDLSVMQNEMMETELGFNTLAIAEEYCLRCCRTGMIMIKNENKLTLSLLAHICTLAIQSGIMNESDFYHYSEAEIMDRFEAVKDSRFRTLLRTYREMEAIIRSEQKPAGSFSVRLEVKRRYINPVWKGERLSAISRTAAKEIERLLTYKDATYASVEIG